MRKKDDMKSHPFFLSSNGSFGEEVRLIGGITAELIL